ncbi:sugar transferase [Acuticoccus sp.]|uniref:sugar transferase n=1 Tax=Acuticoccus sp. TaxID=1904378 RepID=UPI003B528714
MSQRSLTSDVAIYSSNLTAVRPVIEDRSVVVEGANEYLTSGLKRMIDVAGSGLLILLASPLLLVTMLAIAVTSPGPVFYLQMRTGRGGRPFRMVKFRSMVVDAEREGFRQASKGDPRITPVGRLIRRFSVDEVPQLFNVFVGDMSLVGPRPHPLALDALYVNLIPNYHRRFEAIPGMTGLAQVNGARGETPTVHHMAQRLDYDLQYLRTSSLLCDLRILLSTIREVVGSAHAH